MKLTRENILAKTSRGLKIYDFILELYYPGVKMTTQNPLKPVPNPFYEINEDSLFVYVKNECARHQDLDLQCFYGDVFEFANLHYRAACDEELFLKLNNDLHLKLDITEEILIAASGDEGFWHPEFSFFNGPVQNIHPKESISLSRVHELISEPYYKSIVTHLRSLERAEDQRAYKAKKFPYVCFSGTFRARKDKDLLKASGLVVFDFDKLPAPEQVKQLLLKDEAFDTELLFVSPSGQGLKWVVKNKLGAEHRKFFNGASAYLKKRYDLEVDTSGRDVSRACFLSYDPEAFLHERHVDNEQLADSN